MSHDLLTIQLVSHLDNVKTDPWSLLIYQTLLWSFRRWAIHYLTSDDMDGLMKDYTCDTHLDLVRQFAPTGLKDFGIIWLNPANVGDRVDNLEELNIFFMGIVDKLDDAIQNDDENQQNNLAIFLDCTITEIIDEWLDGRKEYRIYPLSTDSPDIFPSERIFEIMQLIMETTIRPAVVESLSQPSFTEPVEPSIEPVVEPVVQPFVEQSAQPPVEPFVEQSAQPPVEPSAQPSIEPSAQPPVEPSAQPPVKPISTISTALRRRYTLRLNRRMINVNTRKNKMLQK